jgi:hypothetical protein
MKEIKSVDQLHQQYPRLIKQIIRDKLSDLKSKKGTLPIDSEKKKVRQQARKIAGLKNMR